MHTHTCRHAHGIEVVVTSGVSGKDFIVLFRWVLLKVTGPETFFYDIYLEPPGLGVGPGPLQLVLGVWDG